MLLLHHVAEKGEVIPKGKNRAGIADPGIRTQSSPEKGLGHRRHVLVRESHIGPQEEGVSRSYREIRAWPIGLTENHMRRDDLFDHRHRSRSGFDHRSLDPAGHPGLVVLEEAPLLHDRPRDGVEPPRELLERDRLTRQNAGDESEIRGGQEPDVLTVLAVDLLDRSSDHEANPGPLLRIRRRLAARPASLGKPAHHHLVATRLHLVGAHALLPHPGEYVVGQGLVVVKTSPGRGDLIGGDVVHQAELGIPIEVSSGSGFPAQLLGHEIWILGQIEDPPLETHVFLGHRSLLSFFDPETETRHDRH